MGEQTGDSLLIFRWMMIIGATIALVLGWGAQSEGVLWESGRNARIGTETSVPTLSWVVYGILMLLAGVLPWKRLGRYLKR